MSAPNDKDDPKAKKTDGADKAGSKDRGGSKDTKGMPALTPEDVDLIGGRAISTVPLPPSPPPPPPPVTGPPITVTANPPPPPPPPPPPVTGPPITVTANPPPVTGSPPSSPPQDPYDPNFDCNSATPAEKSVHNILAAAQTAANAITSQGTGSPGGATGYNNKEYGVFTYRDTSGADQVSPAISGQSQSITAGFTYTQSTPGGAYDQIQVGGQTIPISSITGFVHNHPTNPVTTNQSEQPLPSVESIYSTPTGEQIQGDYAFMQQIVSLGANANDFTMSIYAEPTAGAGYNLYTYPYSEEPPYDPNDPSTWVPNYGPTVSPTITPC